LDEFTTNAESSPRPTSEPPAPQRDLRRLFVANNGLIRAGWGIALFILISFAYLFGLNALLRLLHPAPLGNGSISPSLGLIFGGLQLLCVVIATGALALIERKSLLAYGYQGAYRAVRFISGLAWGFIAISALVLTLWKSHLLVFDGQLLHGVTIWKNAALWGLAFIGSVIFEESLLRGYVQYTFTRGVGFWWGALIFYFLFGFGHGTIPGETPIGLFSAGAVGLIWCLSLWYTGSLCWAVGFHAAWDWGESYFYGASDSGHTVGGHLFAVHSIGNILWSGGKTGPEGSLLVIPLLLLIALFTWLWWRHRVQSPFAGSGWRPAWSRRP
jgi:hypothetical protein